MDSWGRIHSDKAREKECSNSNTSLPQYNLGRAPTLLRVGCAAVAHLKTLQQLVCFFMGGELWMQHESLTPKNHASADLNRCPFWVGHSVLHRVQHMAPKRWTDSQVAPRVPMHPTISMDCSGILATHSSEVSGCCRFNESVALFGPFLGLCSCHI